jgi:thiamine biosynthesis lipoprotein
VIKAGSSLFGAWSCTMRLVVADDRILAAATADLVGLLDRVDHAASRFRADSELTRANRQAGRPIPVSRLLTDLIGAALDTAARTGGLVDPTVGLSMNAIGYDRDINAIGIESRCDSPSDSPSVAAGPARRSWRDIRLNRDVALVTVPIGSALDLGATAKAFTADLAARTLHARYGVAVLVELGGDLAVAGDHNWPIWVAEREGGNGQSVNLTRGGLATSTTTVRQWRRDGRAMHHIVDPRTGAPAAGPWRTVSVFAESALAANTASTAAIVLGDGALPWLEANHIAARLIDHSGRPTITAGWPIESVVELTR